MYNHANKSIRFVALADPHVDDEEWITVTLRAVPGASMSEFLEPDESKKPGGPKKHHRRIPSAIAFAEAKAVAAKGMAPPVPSVSFLCGIYNRSCQSPSS
jgi:hypothetical protein